jgi:hypothetical protein
MLSRATGLVQPLLAPASLPRQVAGPFEGLRLGVVDVSLIVRDLSTTGCLIELEYPVVIGRHSTLQIKLPGEGWIAVRAEILRIRDSAWLAAKFIGLDAATLERLGRGIARSVRRTAAQR